MDNLIIEFNQEHNFYKITCPEGYYITDYDENDGIKSFYETKSVYCPGTMTTEDIKKRFYTITDEEAENFIAQREKAMESEMDSSESEE